MLKVYEWEHAKWPEFRAVHLVRDQQQAILKKLSRHFKTCLPGLKYSYKWGVSSGEGGGSYHARVYNPFIRISKVTTLGTLCHEFAHHLNAEIYHQSGHAKSFKRALSKVYTFARRYLAIKEMVKECQTCAIIGHKSLQGACKSFHHGYIKRKLLGKLAGLLAKRPPNLALQALS